MSGRRASLAIVAALLVGAAVFLFLRLRPGPAPREEGSAPAGAVPHRGADAARPAPAVASGSGEAPSPIADALNAPEGDIRRDLEIVNELFVAWQSNFPSLGNPVGENAEITAALAGENPLRFAFIPRRHRAIDAAGRLCDRWGTPFRLHQLSGTLMEIRSAGPDRKFATADDASWPAAGAR